MAEKRVRIGIVGAGANTRDRHIPGFRAVPGVEIAGVVNRTAESSQKIARISEALAAVDRRGVPQWIDLDKNAFAGTIRQLPAREDVTLPIREQLIIELYSK